MTLIGIAGSTGLLLTGFGLHDSICDIMNKQFDELSHDNFKIVFVDDSTLDQQNDVINANLQNQEDCFYSLICEDSVICSIEGHSDAATSIIVPKDIAQFQSMRVIRDRQTKEDFVIDDEGVYVTEKLAKMSNLSVGDTMTVHNQDLIGNAGSEKYEFKIAGIVENYIGHYIYMTPNVYKATFGKDCEYSCLLASVNVTGDAQQTFISNIKNNSCVKGAFFTTSTREQYERSLDSVNMVVIVLIVAAALLAFVVLYNLININLCERIREIATLKVLGSNRREINMYIHRETFMLSALGALIGLLFGFVLEHYVSASAEVDFVMFGQEINTASFFISIGITLVFTIIVVFFMRKKLFSISMVESLKSVE